MRSVRSTRSTGSWKRVGLSRSELRALGPDRAVVEALLKSGKVGDDYLPGLVESLLDPPRVEPVTREVSGDLVIKENAYWILPRGDRERAGLCDPLQPLGAARRGGYVELLI